MQQLHGDGTKFLTILDPCISIGEPAGTYPPFDRGEESDVWTKEGDGVRNAESKASDDQSVLKYVCCFVKNGMLLRHIFCLNRFILREIEKGRKTAD